MKTFKVAGNDLAKLFKKRYFRFALIVITIIPLLYSLLYLAAFWDPYSRLENVPIAVVNLDKGAENNGLVNYGDKIINDLKSNDAIGWRFTNYYDALQGVTEAGGYYAMIVIPEDFSVNVLSAKNGTPTQPKILFTENQKKNFIQTQINGKLILELKEKIGKSITEEYTLATFESLDTLKKGMGDAALGSSKLADALTTAADGSTKLNEGIGTALDGANQLDTGMNQLQTGAQTSAQGAAQINAGVSQFVSEGVEPVGKGIHDLNTGLTTKILPSVAQISAGAENLTVGLSKANQGAIQLEVGANSLSQGIVAYTDAVSTSQKALEKATNENLKAYLAKNPQAMKDPDLQKFLATLTQLSEAQKDPVKAAQVKGLIAGASQVATGATQLEKGIQTAESGSKALADGTSQLNKGIRTDFASGLAKLDTRMPVMITNAHALVSGTTALTEGLKKLETGVTSLNNGSTQLVTGMESLYTGSGELMDGLMKINSGGTELNEQLSKGSIELNDSLINDSQVMSEFIAEPVVVESTYLNPVENYGKGFTPYFIALSLWVGALLIFFVVSNDVDEAIQAKSLARVLGKYMTYCFIGTIQAVVVSIVVLNLGLHPSNVGLFFVTNIGMSYVFIAIVQFLILTFKDGGRVIGIIMLIFQLTACAGTFPIEIVPKFFQAINAWMPFTYTVSALREVIAGIDYKVLGHQYEIMAAMLIGFLMLSVVSSYFKTEILLKSPRFVKFIEAQDRA